MGRTTRAVLGNRIRAGMQVADVGANQGIFTLLMSRLVGPQGLVVAVEPEATMAGVLSRNLRANGVSNVTLVEAAAGSQAGEATLFRSLTNAGDNRLARGEFPESCRRSSVSVVRLDDVVPDHWLDFIKIDTQGWEVAVLEGMPCCLRENPKLVILFEFWPYGLRNAGRDPADLLAMLRDLGFKILTAKGSTIASTETSTFLKRFRARRYVDLLAVRP